jgi:hypothetical protein
MPKQNEQHRQNPQEMSFARTQAFKVEKDPAERNHQYEDDFEGEEDSDRHLTEGQNHVGKENGIDPATHEEGENPQRRGLERQRPTQEVLQEIP